MERLAAVDSEKFLSRHKNRVRRMKTPCWIWRGTSNHKEPKGYGQIFISGKMVMAHRAFYEAVVGPIPEGLVIDHLCRNALCVNPKHMEPVTQKENVLRGEGLAAENARKKLCIHGHKLFGRNLYTDSSGRRGCLTCKRRTARIWARKNKSKD